MANFGTRPTNQTAAPHLVTSSVTQKMAVEFLLDPTLSALGQDPFLPNANILTVPRGRLLGIKNPQTSTLPAYAAEGKMILTLANGSEGQTSGGVSTDVYPIGFAEENYYRQYEETIQPFPAPTKDCVISLPYVDTSNGAYGRLKPGDYVTAYFGNANNSNPIPQEVGKVVKWVPKGLYFVHQAASTTVVLTQAVYPAFVPRLVSAANAGTNVSLSGATLAYDNAAHVWKATLGGAATDVYFEWGQTVQARAGQLISFEAVGNAGGALDHLHHFPGWLQWVRDNYGAWQLPPLTVPRPYTDIAGENIYGNVVGTNQWRLGHYPVVPFRQINVYVTGTQVVPAPGTPATYQTINLDGTTPLPLANNTWLSDYCFGLDYMLNPVTGVLTLDSSITANAITVDYSYETGYLDGKLYDAGVLGLTDGRYSGVPGTPANLELYGVLAEMKVLIF